MDAHKERRQREIAQVKQQILGAARQLAKGNGWPAVSIRKISEIIAYTPPVIYEHFKGGKEEILNALENRGFETLKNELEVARLSATEPLRQLDAISIAFWNFAFRETDLYQVMFNLEGIRSEPPSQQAIRECGEPILETLRYLHTFPAERESLFFNWWAMSHGYVSLSMSGQIPLGNETLRQYYLQAVQRLAQVMN